MKQEKIQEMIDLNTNFYEKNAKSFSKTRNNPWSGWYELLEIFNAHFSKKVKVSVLDVGCGNARFYKFLTENMEMKIDYLGLDNNDYFLIQGISDYDEANFKKTDIYNELEQIKQTFDLVTAFGVTHHLPGADFRENWFKSLVNLLNPGGLLVITFWQLDKDKRFNKAVKAEYLEEGDYFYGWQETEDKRYVHLYNREEISMLCNHFNKNELEKISDFENDGRVNNLNRYLIFRRS